MNNNEYIKDLENFITDELLPAYIENCARLGRDPNQSYIVRKLLTILKTKQPIPALLRTVKIPVGRKK